MAIFVLKSRLKKAFRILLRILKISGIVLAGILILLFLAPYLFPDTVSRQIKQLTNQSIKGELNFSKASLSFFTHFPSLTLNLHDVELKGSAPFQQDTLLSANRLGFGINLKKLIFDHQFSINKIYLNGAFIHVMVNEKGEANYNIYVSDTTVKKVADTASAASLHLEKIIIKDSRLLYNDQSVPMLIQAEHLFYEGAGDLSQSIFDLSSHISTDSLNFTINKQSYVRRKAIDATLITRINTKTLALIFQNNKLRINKLNFEFTGKLDFLKNGYDLDFSLSTRDADLYQLVTIFPPEYLDWLRKTTVKGTINLNTSLKGKYITSAGEMPEFKIRLGIHDGYIAYEGSSLPVSSLKGLINLELPALDPEKLHVKVDSLSFRMDKDFFNCQMEIRGFREPVIRAKADAQLDLLKLKKAMGITGFDMNGQILMHLKLDGKYAKKIIKTGLRKKDTVVASIPTFDFQCTLKNGLIKYNRLTQPVEQIFLNIHANCPDPDYRHAFFKIDSLHVRALNNYAEGKGIIHASADFPMDLQLKAFIDLADISKIYPMDSLTLSGQLRAQISSTGKYAPDHHLLPKTSATVSLQNGFIQTHYYPHPVENIHIELQAKDETADMKGLNISIPAASMAFEGKPFEMHGSFKNFDDMIYDLSLNGDLDLGRIYQVFAIKDVNLTGMLSAHADFKGKQSDAKSARYDLLNNSGSLEVKELVISQELFPKPFIIHHGYFRFEQEKMWFEKFQAGYGKSDLQLDGFVENAINFVLGKNEILKANFNLKSNNIDLNEFSVYAPAKNDSR